MSTPTKIFNSHFKELCDDLLILFPNYKPLSRAQYTIDILLKTKPSIIIKFWKLFGTKYETEIEKQGLLFFVHNDFTEDAKTLNAEYMMEYIKQIGVLIQQMNQENQNKVLDYINNLIKISKLYES